MRATLVLLLGASLVGCSGQASTPLASTPPKSAAADAAALAPQAGFVEAPSRAVTLEGKPVTISATAHLFYNLWPADKAPDEKPIFVLFNGFADDIVRAYGTGPSTVVLGGDVVPNPLPLTRYANLLYIEPRQAGYSYDVVTNRAPGAADCSPDIFNEYVDAADVLFGVIAVLAKNEALHGPVYWFGESYGGVRVTWILAYLRSRWSLAPYSDPTLADVLGHVKRKESLFAGQILLEPWLGGGDDTTAIASACGAALEISGVEASLGKSCDGADACSCATSNGRSLYNYAYTETLENEREYEADLAHTVPARAEALLGVSLQSIDGLSAAARSKGFKCSLPDDTVPSDAELVSLLGALPSGQSYFVPYAPLQPGKETTAATLDWRTQPYEALAFADNLHDVPAFITKGDKDLVVPTIALAPALRQALGASKVDTASSSQLGIRYSDGERFAHVFEYPDAGHMITMLAPTELSRDLGSWLP